MGMNLYENLQYSNPGYRMSEDLAELPLKMRFNDLRAHGKGLSLGEYGVKTHPAWTVENGGRDYHVARTEEEQQQLFLAVAHYALGLGAAKIQNWCLRDGQAWVFPWGIFHPDQFVPKDVAYWHRNQAVLWRYFKPVYTPARLVVCLPSRLRVGNNDGLGATVVAPFVPGKLNLPARGDLQVAIVGEFRNGQWTVFERLTMDQGAVALDIDADRFTCLILLCKKGDEARA